MPHARNLLGPGSPVTRRRWAAASIAILLNVLMLALLVRRGPAVRYTVAPEELMVISLALPREIPVVRVQPPRALAHAAPIAPHQNPPPVDIPIGRGPPTETVAKESPIAQKGRILDTAVLIERCRAAVDPAAANAGTTVEFRVFVMPDGRIAQGAVSASSGDDALDRSLLGCVQSLANIPPVIVDDLPVGAWQSVTLAL